MEFLMLSSLLVSFDNYTKLPTRFDPNGMPEESKRVLTLYMKRYVQYLDETKSVPNKNSFASFLVSLSIGVNTKSVICQRLGKFLLWENLISKDDFAELRRMFRYVPNDWGSKAIDIGLTPRILSAIEKKHNKYARARDMLMTYIMATIGTRVGQTTRITQVAPQDKVFYIEFPLLKKVVSNDQRLTYRTIPLTHQWGDYKLVDLYEEYNKMRPDGKYYFLTKTQKKVSEVYIRNMFYDIAQDLGIHITPHTLRHTVGTFMANHKGILQANLLLGHSKIETTQKYITPSLIDIEVPSMEAV